MIIKKKKFLGYVARSQSMFLCTATNIYINVSLKEKWLMLFMFLIVFMILLDTEMDLLIELNFKLDLIFTFESDGYWRNAIFNFKFSNNFCNEKKEKKKKK